MSLIIPNSTMIREPNLLIPGRKPVGPVRVDWSLPITRGLAYVFIWQSRVCFDLVTRRVIKLTNAVDLAVAHDSRGAYINHSGRGIAPSTYRPFAGIGTTPVTMMSHFRVGTTSRQSVVCSRIDIGDDQLEIRANADGKGRESAGEVSWVSSDAFGASMPVATFDPNNWTTVAGTASGTAARLYVDGHFKTYETIPQMDIGGNPDFVFGGLPGTSAIEYTGDRSWDYAWLRELSPAEIKSLHDDPYQFLVPA